MKWIIWLTLVLIPIELMAMNQTPLVDECRTPEDCVTKIYNVIDRSSSPSQYPSTTEQAIIQRLLELGDEAMPFIIQLLEDDDELIARVAAVALRNAKSIDAKYLPAIIRGIERDVSWLAPALARVGTPEAADVLVKHYLVSKSRPHNQESYALRLFGEKAFPTIMKAAKCDFGCAHDTYYVLAFVFSELEESERRAAAKYFITAVEDKQLSVSVRSGVLEMLSALGAPAIVIEDNLLRLEKSEPDLEEGISNALIGIRSKHAGRIYAKILSAGFSWQKVVELALEGINGYEAGPVITPWLDSNNKDVVLLTARTLGFIQYAPAAPELIRLFNAHSDIKLQWVIVESLGRMKSTVSLPILHSVADTHWFPPIRDAATDAIAHIESGSVYDELIDSNSWLSIYYDYEHFDVEVCKEAVLVRREEPQDQKLYSSDAQKDLIKLSYQTQIIGFGAGDEEQQRAEDPDAIIRVTASNLVEIREELEHVPQVALRVNGGWLAGGFRGEWGGEVVFISDTGQRTIFLNAPIEDIYQFEDKYIAITGLAHLATNTGMIYELYQDENGTWLSKEWLSLPGAPQSSWFVETGEILINTWGGGSILLDKSGSMRMAECKQSQATVN